jgi:hypothetical protein
LLWRIVLRSEEMADGRVLLGCAYSADDRRTVRLLVKRPLHPQLVELRSSIMISLLMFAMSASIWGAVYLLNSALLR